MQNLLRRIWQWFKSLLGLQSNATVTGTSRRSHRQGSDPDALIPLSDTDYEFLFTQLLEGISHGWQDDRVAKFFSKLGTRGKMEPWVSWLQRFGTQVLASSAPNHQLAGRLIQLGETTQSHPNLRRLGEVASDIGTSLLTRDTGSAVWEYEGPDAEPVRMPSTTSEWDFTAPEGDVSLDNWNTASEVAADSDNATVETLTLDQLFERLQQEPQLMEQIAQQLQIETDNPNEVIQALVNQFNASQSEVEVQPSPVSIEDWFNQGLQSASRGELEQAITAWDKALELDPNLAQAWHNRGSALGHLGRLEESLASFERAIAINPEDFRAWNDCGHALYNLQRWEEAVASWDKVLELQENFYQAWYNRGCALEQLGQVDAAMDCYKKALELQPDFDLAQAKLSQWLGDHNGRVEN
jgi:tetratricopeptide (TPR) repeat protein